ncbi:MAG TPA: haloalkane dehalogenase [Rhodobacteraceae bacterium]|jgi:haloalkane dehalogenase|nr:alpha/beta fold hydrolase [Paracoccaceae bacterium]MBT6544260.1 alpha/beta fold hydrolase [Paracoccaceae bacterium]MDE2633487.1 haloalkane dehalogenase [Paracoccaceae bacterium]HBR62040.1 haloalkane dehalogenase [Paracoccaceae bacterium]HBS37660.1 haloalkane dehalogenase [Paracoccaceae bacterium]|tara:strand:+ start:12722 stop:13621 length:900 start_codon:yes stop_codon:yes gene_type:complete
MSVKRTPDVFFENLTDWPHPPQYLTDLPSVEGLRVHYIDTGEAGSERVFLCLHGQPTWSYLYRKMIPVFTASGARVVAPDLLGFGRSDKPVDAATYGFEFHRQMLLDLIDRLDLKNITLVMQDWGGLLGLTLPMARPSRITRLLVMNTTLATGTSPSRGFESWRAYCRANPDLQIGRLMQRSVPAMTQDEAAAYDAPFPDGSYKAGVRRFPEMVMTAPDMEGTDISKQAIEYLSTTWQGQSFMAIGMQDPVLGPKVMTTLRATIRGCPPPLEMAIGGHFLQEWGQPVAQAALAHWEDTK